MPTRIFDPPLIDDSSRSNRAEWYCLWLLACVHIGLLAYSATRHSPTILEPSQLVAGLRVWEVGRFDLYRVNPPLTRMVASLPAAIVGFHVDWTRCDVRPGARPEWPVGIDFVRCNGPRALDAFVLARWACVPFSVIGLVTAFLWAKSLYGGRAGLLAATFWTFEPNLLAHGELITSDAAANSMGLLAGYMFSRWLNAPTVSRVLLAGLCLGLAELSKTTWIVLFALWPALWCVARWWRTTTCGPDRQALSGQALAQQASPTAIGCGMILLIGVYVLNLGYAFQGTFRPLSEYSFVSRALAGVPAGATPDNRFRGSWAGHLPVPLPQEYLLGLDAQRKDLEDYDQISFLNGEWRQGGWWYYYAWGACLKLPCGVLLLGATLVARRLLIQGRVVDIGELVLLAPPLVVFAAVSSQMEFNQHLRYILPAFGPAMVFLGQAWNASDPSLRPCRKVIGPLGTICLLASVVSSLATYPHHLAYFNEFAGGPKQGPHHLRGSNVDWGQDWLLLAEWTRQQPDRPVMRAVGSVVAACEIPDLFPDIRWSFDANGASASGVDFATVAPVVPCRGLDGDARRLRIGVFEVRDPAAR